ncbi:MAG: hypothetical protein ACFE95_08955, partial [Candidatus Hodarchaeota archaeon]
IPSIIILNINPLLGILFIFPGTLASIGFIQAREKFCAAYGFSSVANVSVKLGKTVRIKDEIDRKKDRNKSIMILIQSILIGIITAAILTVLGIIIQQL